MPVNDVKGQASELNSVTAVRLVVHVGVLSASDDECLAVPEPSVGAAMRRLAPAKAASALRGRALAARMLTSIGAASGLVTRSVTGAPLAAGYSISITHAGIYSAAAVCVGSHRLGIDLEAWHMPTASQARRLGCGTEPLDFTKRWTTLEAYSKASGIPLVRLLGKAQLTVGRQATPEMNECIRQDRESWQVANFVSLPAPALHEMTLAVLAPDHELVVRQWKETN